MRIIFIQELYYEWQAPMIFSAIAKSKGHTTSMLIEGSWNKAAKKAMDYNPQLIVFSNINSGNMNYVYNCVREIKQHKDIKVLVGGVYISLNYQYINMQYIDFLGIGEGEITFSFLLDRLQDGNTYKTIPGLVYKTGDEIHVNTPKSLKELDSLPFLDRDLYYKYFLFRNEKVRMFYSGRGCEYNCSYCCVPQLGKMDPTAERVRRRSPENLIKEILEVNAKWKMKMAFFQDDTFTQNEAWLVEFLHLYKKYIDKPFMCMTRARDICDVKLIELLRSSGCISVGIGVETANEVTRSQILHRVETNESIRYVFQELQKNKIRVTTFNMIGITGESRSDIDNTIVFNKELNVASAWAVFYQPYLHMDRKTNNNFGNFYTGLSEDNPDKEYLELVQRYFSLIVKYPWVKKLLGIKIMKDLSYMTFALHSFYREFHIWHRSFSLSFITGVKNQLQYKKNSNGTGSNIVRELCADEKTNHHTCL